MSEMDDDRAIPGEGLRDRKKRLLRQLISDTATQMFLDRGFDAVKVSEIAEACEVSEKTVYNYFPSKESLLFDREEEMAESIRSAFSDRDTRSLTDAAIELLDGEIAHMYDHWITLPDPNVAVVTLERFSELIERTPDLVAAQQAMMERLTQTAAETLAERAGLDPEDPEPQLAAVIVTGLWRTMFISMRRHSRSGAQIEDVRAAVTEDVHRAAVLANAGLASFNLAVYGSRTKDQMREATEITNEARKQVLAAVKQAKDAWRQVMADMQASQIAAQTDLHLSKAELKAQQHAMRDEIRRRQAEIRRTQAELRRKQLEARRAAHDERKRKP